MYPRSSHVGVVISLSGDLDRVGAQEMRPHLGLLCFCASELPEPVVVDLSEVTFIDGGGLMLLGETQRLVRARGGTLRLRGVPTRIRRLIRRTGADGLLGPLSVVPAETDGSGEDVDVHVVPMLEDGPVT